jgi:hypothetical protein
MSQNPVFGHPISKPPILSDFHAAARNLLRAFVPEDMDG